MKTIKALRILGLFVPVALSAQSPNQSNAQKAERLDAYVSRAVRDWNVPGLAIAVVKDGQVVFSKAYGVREIGKPELADTSTLFAIASTTKAMTAASIGMLVDEGKLKWDDRVTKFIPNLEMYDPFVTRELTVRDLLTHRTGLGNTDFMWDVDDYTMPEIIQRLKLLSPEYSFRSGFVYQNVMYMLAGEVIRAASGMPWQDFVKKRIFVPLDMKSSVALERLIPNGADRATPHWLLAGDTVVVVHYTDGRAIGPAGGVWSNISDMSRWMNFLLDSGEVGGKRLLAAQTYAELFKPQIMVPADEFYPTARFTNPHWTTYGLGWFQEDYDGRMLNFHTGSLNGMVSIIGLVQDARFGVYVLANLDHAELRHALMYKAIDTYLENPPRDWSTEFNAFYASRRKSADSTKAAEMSKRILGTKPSAELSKYTGLYEDPLLGRMEIIQRDGKLRLIAGRNYAGDLEHFQNDTFLVRFDQRWQGTDLVNFSVSKGTVTLVSLGGLSLARVRAGGAPATH